MKRWVLVTVGCLGVLGMIAVITKPSDIHDAFTMHGVMKNHAVLHTHDDEAFTFEIILNDSTSYYSYEEAMVSHALTSGDDGFKAMLHLESVTRQPLDEDALKLALTYTLPYESESERMVLDPATLNIHYDDGMQAEIPLGTFAYHFPGPPALENTLDYEKLTVLSVDGEDGATAGGACVDLLNKGETPLVVDALDPLNHGLEANMDYFQPYEGTPTPFTPLESLFGPLFNPRAPSVAKKEAVLQDAQATTLCVPFRRHNDFKSDMLPFAIGYESDGVRQTLFIDEFLYIKAREASGHWVEKEEGLATLEPNPED